MTAMDDKPSNITLPEKSSGFKLSEIPSPGPEWSAEWPPFSSKHRQRIERPPMPDRKHSGMLDEEEDTRDIDLGNLSKKDMVRVLKDIRDDLAKLKLIGTAFTYRIEGGRLPVHPVEGDMYIPGTKYGIDVDALEMKTPAAVAAYEESNGMRMEADRRIKKAAKAALKQKLLQEAVYDEGYFNNGGYAYAPSYGGSTRATGGPPRRFCYECGNKLGLGQDRCNSCVAKAAGLDQMEQALRKMSLAMPPPSVGTVPALTIRTPEHERDDELELETDGDEGSDYASTTASSLSDNAVGIPIPVGAGAGAGDVEPMIVGSVPPEEFNVPVPEEEQPVVGKTPQEVELFRSTF